MIKRQEGWKTWPPDNFGGRVIRSSPVINVNLLVYISSEYLFSEHPCLSAFICGPLLHLVKKVDI